MATPTPIVVVATMTAKPESVDAVREACKQALEAVHQEPGCELYSVHEADGTFVFVEQWADADALKAHSSAPGVTTLFGTVGDLLAAPPDIKLLKSIAAGDPAKGQLRP
jgi:quinol monooxygenase YgiN